MRLFGERPARLGAARGCDVRLPRLAPLEASLLYHSGLLLIYSLAEESRMVVGAEKVAWAVVRDNTILSLGPYSLQFVRSAE